MTRMKKVELDYALTRLTNIYKKRNAVLTPAEPKKLGRNTKIGLLRANKVNVKERLSSWHDHLDDVFDWKPFETQVKDVYKKDREKLLAEYTRIKDELILGESTEALEAIRKFEADNS